MTDHIPEYGYDDATLWSDYLWPAVKKIIEDRTFRERRAFDLGCGNGSISNLLSQLGFDVVGVDPSESGITMARRTFPHVQFQRGNAYDDLAEQYGAFPLVVSLEVVEHCYNPRKYAQTLSSLVEDRGIAIVSTPYHGYLKNLALAVTGKWDMHLGPLWDGGHIKFFSITTLCSLLNEAGFREVRIFRIGRIPPLAKSMVAVASK
jgi:2-polyprenyl-3-methyl-5-hydroxy-6-metoxy-1,4-benzoquinol methylase